jgi:hypothetical protein
MATKHFRPLLLGPVHLLTINFRLILLFGNGYKLANMPVSAHTGNISLASAWEFCLSGT